MSGRLETYAKKLDAAWAAHNSYTPLNQVITETADDCRDCRMLCGANGILLTIGSPAFQGKVGWARAAEAWVGATRGHSTQTTHWMRSFGGATRLPQSMRRLPRTSLGAQRFPNEYTRVGSDCVCGQRVRVLLRTTRAELQLVHRSPLR